MDSLALRMPQQRAVHSHSDWLLFQSRPFAYLENAVKWLVFHRDVRSQTIRGGHSSNRRLVSILAGVTNEKQGLPGWPRTASKS